VGVLVRVGLGPVGKAVGVFVGELADSFKISGRYITESALLISRDRLLYRSEKLRYKRRHKKEIKNRKWDILYKSYNDLEDNATV